LQVQTLARLLDLLSQADSDPLQRKLRTRSKAILSIRTSQPMAPNHSLERTQPQRDFMYDVVLLRRSARGR